jgi:hypothetical protein
MTAVSPLVFPGGRVLAGWWRQLALPAPRSLWVGHFLLHRVEALVEVTRRTEVDRLSRLVVRALDAAGGPSVPDLDARLHLGPQVLGRVLRQLQSEGLAEPDAAGGWVPTALARQALDQGGYTQTGYERRVFHFLDRHGTSVPPLVPLRLPAEAPGLAPGGWAFDPGWLADCLRQPEAWKRAHGFPVEARRVLGPEALNGGPAVPHEAVPAWQRVVLDRPVRLTVLLARVAAEGAGDRLIGFEVRPEGWVLEAAEPAFVLQEDWPELFPEVVEDTPADSWRQAWRTWCQPRAIPAADLEACSLEKHDYHLRVAAPRRLVERLRAARSDALKGEAWVLAGTGPVRGLALLEVAEAGE